MNKKLLFLLIMLVSQVSITGEDVPWPYYIAQNIRNTDMEGQWMNNHSDHPYMYDVRTQATGITDCPFVLLVAEVDMLTTGIYSHGAFLYCEASENAFQEIRMFTAHGRELKTLKMAAIRVSSHPYFVTESLNLVIFDANEDTGNAFYQDIFYKVDPESLDN